MDILISGAGVAGPTLAYWLRRAGARPVLAEQSPQFRAGGYVVDFWGVGYDVAEKMGLLPELRRRGYFVEDVRFVNGAGERVAGFGAAVFARGTNGRFVSVRRGDLAEAIFSRVKDDVEVLFGDSITSLDDDGDRVRASFAHAPPRAFDLVIGADGLHSNVRRLVFGAEESFETFLGYQVAAFEVRGYPRRDELAYVMYNEPGLQAARFALRDDRTLFLLIFAEQGAPETPQAADAQKALLRRKFGDAGWECRDILAAMDRAEALYLDRVSQIRMPCWRKGRVALVGDAAACPSLLAGEGSGMAMAEAYVLAGELRRAGGDHATAFARYEAALTRFVAEKQKAAASFAASFAPKTRFGIAVRNLVVKAMVLPLVADLAIGRSLRDDLVLPDYADSPALATNTVPAE